jgi:hypothetical protein
MKNQEKPCNYCHVIAAADLIVRKWFPSSIARLWKKAGQPERLIACIVFLFVYFSVRIDISYS